MSSDPLSTILLGIFSGIGTEVLKFLSAKTKIKTIFNRDRQTQSLHEFFPEETETIIEPTPEEPYRITLGRRHRELREVYLELTLREMADFYELETGTQVENYEKGEEEFPRSLIKKLVDFFFVNQDFFDKKSRLVFQNFSMFNDDISNLLDQGFRPYFLCNSENRSQLETYVVFHKKEKGLSRTVVSNVPSSFMSNHGGKSNIFGVIYGMIKKHMGSRDASVVKVNCQTWNALRSNTFYSENMCFPGQADYECEDIFENYFRSAQRFLNDSQKAECG
jgi:hypothetical protein